MPFLPPVPDAPAPGGDAAARGERLPVVALVASAGGLAALSTVLAALPAAFPAAVLVLQHLEAGRQSVLSQILRARTALEVCEAADGEPLRAGTAYVAPSGRHLRVSPARRLQLTDTEKVEHSRPSADVLLRSLAAAGGPVVAVVLTGRGRDGAAGSLLVHQGGGTVLAQDRATSEHYGMPGAASLAGGVDRELPLDAIAPALVRLIDTLLASSA